MIFEMLRWWYITGWLQALRRINIWTSSVEHAFSLSLLMRTLFSPWRRIVSNRGKGLDAKMQASLDNLVSRCVGFVIRSTVIFTAGLAMTITFLAGIFMALVWPLLPVLVIVFLVKGITG